MKLTWILEKNKENERTKIIKIMVKEFAPSKFYSLSES